MSFEGQSFGDGVHLQDSADGELLEFHKRLIDYRPVLVSLLLGREVSLLSNMPGNFGDQLIYQGTEVLLSSMNVPFTQVGVQKIPETTGDLLVIPGSGAWTASHHEWLPELVLKASCSFKSIVILPSAFDPNVELVAEALSLKNVFPFAREDNSYNRVKTFAKIELGFDPALYALPKRSLYSQTPLDFQTQDLKQTLVALRTDNGSLLQMQNLRINENLNDDISVSCQSFEHFLQKIEASTTVITDRLHVAVAAFLMGKSLICIDPHESKISNYFQFVLRGAQENFMAYKNNDWLVQNGLVSEL